MLRHCVMFQWSEDASEEAKAALAAGLDEMAALDCVESMVHGPDAGLADGNWDYVVNAEFADDDAYRTYAADPDHMALIAQVIRPILSARAAVQFQL